MSRFDERVDHFDEMRDSAWGRRTFGELVDFADPDPDWRALDVGCGAGNLSMLLAERVAHVTGVDPSTKMIERAQEKCAEPDEGRCEFAVGDACELQFADDAFDLVTTSAVLYLVGDQERAAAEMARVSRRAIALHEPTPDMTAESMDAYLERRREVEPDIADISGWARAAESNEPLDEAAVAALFAPHDFAVARSRRILDGLALEVVLERTG
jgi:ubiquinone/menaquinone biosynthesis C-methylase UbiE